MFTTRDVADYYDQTQVHYERWWDLSHSLSLHYGIWDKDTKTLPQALENTNRKIAERAGITGGERVLDAGCGVGGAAVFMAKNFKARVTGITLSQKQVDYATEKAAALGLSELINFDCQDYTQTKFEDEQFDVVWACESMASARDKSAFIREAFRVLKPGGRLTVLDCYRVPGLEDTHKHLEKTFAAWAIDEVLSMDEFTRLLDQGGFGDFNISDETPGIMRTASKMYTMSLLGAVPSELYNLIFGASRFARKHYQCGIHQYKSLKAGLWKYQLLSATKPK